MPLNEPEAPDAFAESAQTPSPIRRLIGASCGGFVFCFVALLISFMEMQRIGPQRVPAFCIGALVLGTAGGFLFPRTGHLIGYCFLVFVNLMLSSVIGENLSDQILLFGIFSFIELVFFMSRKVIVWKPPTDC